MSSKLTYDQVEALARRAHEAYMSRPGTSPSEEASRPWDELDELYRNQNLDQIRRQEKWLRQHSLLIVEDADARETPTSAEMDQLIETYGFGEHARWMELLDVEGWTLGPRDDERKTHPSLVPWSDLTDADKEKDRAPLRELSEHLSDLGLRIAKA